MLLAGFGEPPDRQKLILRLQLVRDFRHRESCAALSFSGSRIDLDFARVAGEHFDLAPAPGTRARAGRMTKSA